MNIAILSRGEALYSTKSLLNAGEARNHVMEVLDPSYCNLAVENGKAVLYFQNELVDDLDAIIPRIGASNTYFGTNVVRHFEAMGVFTVVSSEGITNSRDKWMCFQLLVKNKIPVPRTLYAFFFEFEEQLKTFDGKPIIIKLLEGTHGEGVILSETPQKPKFIAFAACMAIFSSAEESEIISDVPPRCRLLLKSPTLHFLRIAKT